jgi:hypothetical protein
MPFCSLCGVAFGEPDQVRAHIQGSGGDHAGIGFNTAEEYITDTAPDVLDEDDDAGPAGGAAGAPADEASSPSKASKDAGLGVPEKQVEESKAEQKDDPTCPECGSNRWFDASEHTDYPYGCANCSDGSSWQVYGEEGSA